MADASVFASGVSSLMLQHSLSTHALVTAASLSDFMVYIDYFCVSELSVCGQTHCLNDFLMASELQLSGTVTSAKRAEPCVSPCLLL